MQTLTEQFRLIRTQLERSQWFTYFYLAIALFLSGGVIGYIIAMEETIK